MKTSNLVIAAVAGLCAASVCHAQTCEQPLPLGQEVFGTPILGNTVTAVNSVPAVANGTIATPGGDVVYRLHLSADMYPFSFELAPAAGTTGGMFLCRSCEAPADCVAFADASSGDSVENMQIQGLDGWFYLIVDAMSGPGGLYHLGYNGPLQD